MNKSAKIKLIIIFILLVTCVASISILLNIYNDNIGPVSDDNQELAFTIEEGELMDDVIEKLYSMGLIKDKICTKVYVKLNGIEEYYAGNYLLRANMDNTEIFNLLSQPNAAAGDEVTIRLLGSSWAKEMAALLEENTNLKAVEILAQWRNVEYMYSLMDDYDFLSEDIFDSEHCYLEGYLFPDTYNFYEKTTIDQVTRKILDRTQEIYDKYKDDIAASDMSIHQIFTLASMIQYESGAYEDNPYISSVFHNRLDEGMLLQSSVTVCYALYTFDSSDECEYYNNSNANSPYNTYLHYGLPIGPICNWEESALDAALHPADSDYMYFIGANGETYFATTLAEHERNIAKYLN